MSLLLLYSRGIPDANVGVVNNLNTTVDNLGQGVHAITKTGGVDATWDSDAISTAGLTGDFTIRFQPQLAAKGMAIGINADPTTNASFDTLDRFGWFYADGVIQLGENGAYVAQPATGWTALEYFFFRRVGDTITLHRNTASDFATATLVYTFTALTGTLYFDSSFQTSGGVAHILITKDAAPVSQISGTSTLTFAPTATLSATGALSGTSPLVFAPTASLTGAGALTGNSSLTFAPTATLTGKGVLSGTSPLVFAPTATITGRGALSGTSPLVFSPTATLAGSTALTGTSTLAFAPSATLVGSAALSGTSSILFTPSGNLTSAAGAISGTTTLTFTPTATLTGTAALSGTASLVFTPTGTLSSSGGLSQISGTAALTFTVTGTLTGTTVAAPTGVWVNQDVVAANWLPAIPSGNWTVATPANDQWTKQADASSTWTPTPAATGTWN